MAVAERSHGIVQIGDTSAAHASGHSPTILDACGSIVCLCYNARIPENGESSWRRRLGHDFAVPLLPLGSLVRFMPPPESRLRIAKNGGTMISGIYFGYVHKAGSMVGRESYVAPIRQFD
eukprot:7685053-Pyramimonas_sp.AAC.1